MTHPPEITKSSRLVTDVMADGPLPRRRDESRAAKVESVATYDVMWIDRVSGGAWRATREELPQLLARETGFVWVHIPDLDRDAREMLRSVFGLHPRAIEEMAVRNHVARLHYHKTYLLLVVHSPVPTGSGRVESIELDQVVGTNYLITSPGPAAGSPVAAESGATAEVADRLVAGRLTPTTPIALSWAITSTITNAMERSVNDLAREVGRLEQHVVERSAPRKSEGFLDELFTTRHALGRITSIAAQTGEVFGRAQYLLDGTGDPEDVRLIGDSRDQFLRLAGIARAQDEFLRGVTEFYRARTDTRATVAMERLAVIVAITLPVIALASVASMNVISYGRTSWPWLIGILLAMFVVSAILLRWARRQGWW
ncbi:putative magnesium and cobalt transporter [Nostocoides australiense Ben110]|uniref:Putative magnesium and cobalt transporter n=1 Tax=Nostocoides australiense Ben110 TaxID=1193182 RepID=W6JV68_9MICO|nr:CorA family divalent cation transporter [Tetrasphaera australiensis]CCH72425.1 putative magnesium and cobalt transporter [Tetrasphaera australiensis Ben110]